MGRAPFPEKDRAALLRDVLSSPAPRASSLAPGVPAALDELIAGCLAKSPDDRPRDVAVIVAALDELDLVPWTRDDGRAWWAKCRERRKRGVEN